MLAAASRSDQMIQERFPEITWDHSHICVDDAGAITSFCVYEAPDQEMVREHAQAFGSHTISRIYEVADEVTPARFAGGRRLRRSGGHVDERVAQPLEGDG